MYLPDTQTNILNSYNTPNLCLNNPELQNYEHKKTPRTTLNINNLNDPELQNYERQKRAYGLRRLAHAQSPAVVARTSEIASFPVYAK